MKNLTLTYIIALTVIALVVGLSQFLVQRSIARSTYDSRTINISGRQSMLSQKIAKAALEMETAKNQTEFIESKAELVNASKLWEKSHNALQYGDEEMKMDNVNNSKITLLNFLESEPYYVNMKNAVDLIKILKWNTPNRAKKMVNYANILLKNEGKYARLMNTITFDYDNESRNRLSNLSRTEYLLLGIALLLLVLEAIFVFRPMIKRITDYTAKLLKQEKSLIKALKLQRREKAKVEYLNKQAKSVFENVGQGLFLLNDKYAISELYSKKINEIFEQDNLAKSNFLHLMRTRLVKRDQQALEMFVKHLFNPKINEVMLDQLNPVETVTIHSDSNSQDAGIDTRHLKIGFSRIKDKNKIYSVLVTITDETEAVLLQEKINQSEAKNKRDSEQLLSILTVDPVALRDFLNNSEAQLNDISNRYEKERDGNISNILNYTFNAIHNLKGNASLIDLKILVSKFDEIETIITELRGKADINYKDFIKILFEMNEAKTIIHNMKNMLLRISEVNQKISEEEKANGNEKFVRSIRRGLKKLSDEAGVRTQLNFEDNDITIPERYMLTVKDISVQLIRNSLAHGIEKELKDRLESGKSEVANINISINKTEDENFEVVYSDDGQGLDIDKICEKAVSKNVIAPDDVANMTEADKVKLIFRDDFSTSDDVDHLSGRGQGMPLIKEIIDKNEGKFEISHQKGTFFKLKYTLPKNQPQTAELV